MANRTATIVRLQERVYELEDELADTNNNVARTESELCRDNLDYYDRLDAETEHHHARLQRAVVEEEIASVKRRIRLLRRNQALEGD